MLNLDINRLKCIRSAIDYHPEYTILEDIHIENNKYLIKVKITLDLKRNEYVPKSSEWYIVFNDYDEINFYPSKTNSIFATFPHQSYNMDLHGHNYRSGNPCLDIPSASLDLPEEYYPYNDNKFNWYLERMLDWLRKASTNTLINIGEPFEVPITKFSKDSPLIYKECGINGWGNFNYNFGYSSLKNVIISDNNYYALDWISDENIKEKRESINWGTFGKNFTQSDCLGIWIRCKEFPISKPWSYPETWSELLKICKKQHVDLLSNIVKLLFKNNIYRRYQNIYLLLVCPIPEKFGEEDKDYFWLMCRLPVATFPKDGFRRNIKGFRKYYEYLLKGKIDWNLTLNWDDSVIRTRGRLDENITNLRFGVVGLGALGCNVCELLVRQGVKHLKVADSDILTIGNLARHTLTIGDLTKYKAEALADKLALISPSVKVDFLNQDIFEDNKTWLEDCEVVVDCTGNNKLIDLFDKEFSSPKHFFIGAFNYGATKFAYYYENSEKVDSSLFFLKTKEFYNEDFTGENLIMEGIGCYHPVFPALDSSVKIWASIFVKEIQRNLKCKPVKRIKCFAITDDCEIDIIKDENL